MPELIDIVNEKGVDLINNIRINLGRTGTNATLKTSQSLRQEITETSDTINFKLYGRAFFMTVETGRRPTPDKKPSREMIENLRPWAASRGIDESKVWAIATKIQKQGTQLWRDGGREDIVEPAVDTFVNDLSLSILDQVATDFQIKVRGMKW